MSYPMPPQDIVEIIQRGAVIPASPLALTSRLDFDHVRQKALMRYYCNAGAGGVAVGVHMTQFEIHDPGVGLLECVLKECADSIDEYVASSNRSVVKIAGIVGRTKQAAKEAEMALDYGYHAGLLSFAAFREDTIEKMLDHARAIARVIPIFGFYIQPAVGGRILPPEFWREFALIENVVAIKIAPFNRYQTVDVVRSVAEVGRENEVALYTGNDDNIIVDLITPFPMIVSGERKTIRIRGGLLGQWAVGTRKAVELLNEIHKSIESGQSIPLELIKKTVELTDVNAALFDAANQFSGCIAGVHEILRRQGLFRGIWTLNPQAGLSENQLREIDRVHESYPHFFDDDFVRENLNSWTKE